jgi:carbonic anhydrase
MTSLRPRPAADDIWADLLEGNRRFRTGAPQARDLVSERAAVAAEQHPKAVVLCCGDSRVAPEIIFDQKLGDLFVLRSAGNTADPLTLGSIEFAVQELETGVLVVLGHSHCGGIDVASRGGKFNSVNLKAVAKKLRAAVEQATGAGEERLRCAERLNVSNAARDALDRSLLLHEHTRQGKLAVIQAYYDLDNGEVTRLG